MGNALELWEPVLRRLRLAPRGLRRGALRYAAARLGVDWWAWEDPVRVRLQVRPLESGSGRLLVVPLERSPTVPRFQTGDPDFDGRVAVLAGGRATLCRLGPTLRRDVATLISAGAAFTESGCVFEPEVTAGWTDADTVLELVWLAHDVVDALAGPIEVERLLRRWRVPDAPGVLTALDWQVHGMLPTLTGAEADLACAAIEDRGDHEQVAMLSRMRLTASVLASWLRLGDPLDERLVQRVRDAYQDGDAEPLAHYLVHLLRDGSTASVATAQVLWELGRSDPRVVQSLVARLERPTLTALPFLLEVYPPNQQVAGAIAALLAPMDDDRIDAYLAGWLGDWRASAAIDALVQRVEVALSQTDPDRIKGLRKPVQRTPELYGALVRQLGPFADRWLATLKPKDDASILLGLGRLRGCGKPVDRPVGFWLEHGSPAVQACAAEVLGSVGSADSLRGLEDRASSWRSDAAVRKACREAIAAIKRRKGAGGLSMIETQAGGELSPPHQAGTLSEVDPAQPGSAVNE